MIIKIGKGGYSIARMDGSGKRHPDCLVHLFGRRGVCIRRVSPSFFGLGR